MFNELCKTREKLMREFRPDMVSGIHLPWAGNQVLNPVERTNSLYVVGIATAANYPVQSNFDAARAYSEQDWRDHPKERAGSPFWQFVSGLTTFMYDKRHYECADRWGWSNIFKIAYNDDVGGPSKWPNPFFDGQREACVVALKHEFNQLSKAAIFIASSDDREMLRLVLPTAKWDEKYNEDGLHFWDEDNTGNLYIWGYHPKAARMANPPFFDKMLTRSQSLIRERQQ